MSVGAEISRRSPERSVETPPVCQSNGVLFDTLSVTIFICSYYVKDIDRIIVGLNTDMYPQYVDTLMSGIGMRLR